MIQIATPDDAPEIAPLMFQAMQEIAYKLIGKEDPKLAIDFLEKLCRQENNQYSYQNTLIYKENEQILGSLVFYNGADLHILRKPVLLLSEKVSNRSITMENETQQGEIYIDTLSVSPQAQGKGIGSQLIEYLKKYVRENQKLDIGLLVDEKNPKAEKLYIKLGFQHKNNITLAGSIYKHLVYHIANPI